MAPFLLRLSIILFVKSSPGWLTGCGGRVTGSRSGAGWSSGIVRRSAGRLCDNHYRFCGVMRIPGLFVRIRNFSRFWIRIGLYRVYVKVQITLRYVASSMTDDVNETVLVPKKNPKTQEGPKNVKLPVNLRSKFFFPSLDLRDGRYLFLVEPNPYP
jgi:hypothetical protein